MNIIFLKGSFEDEGLRDFEVQILSSISKKINIPLAFKIGGCEAKSDIERSINYGAKCLVAPMIESNFAAKKFIHATNIWNNYFDERNINIETITAVENLEKILYDNHEKIDGIVVGRSDLALSMGMTKKMVDSKEVMEQVEKTLRVAKKYNLTTTMGGSFNNNSVPHVVRLYNQGLLDRFETRKVIIEACPDNELLLSLLSEALRIENEFLNRTLVNYNLAIGSATDRIESTNKRKE